MGMGWRAFFAALHVVAFVLIGCLIAKDGFVDPAMYDEAKKASTVDALHLALQVGRLDIVSLMVAFYAIFAGVAAVFGFIEVRQRAVTVAGVAAEEEAKRLIQDFLDNKAPGIIREHVEFLTPPMNSNNGDAVATAYLEPKEPKKK